MKNTLHGKDRTVFGGVISLSPHAYIAQGTSCLRLTIIFKKVSEEVQGRKRNPRQHVFTKAMEMELCDYSTTCCRKSHGLTTTLVLELSFKFAVSNNIKNIPKPGIEKKSITRSIRRPEPTSQCRASGFTHVVVQTFFDLLMFLIVKSNFPPSRMWNTKQAFLLCSRH